MDSIAQDLNALGDCTLELTDCAGARVSYGKTLKDMNPEAFERNYQLADSTSSYSGWTFSIYIPKELTSNDISWMSGIVIYGFLIGTGVFLICSLFIARMISKPLSDMRKSMVIADGKLQANDRHYSNSDINELNIHYNALVEKNNCLIEQVFEKEILRTKAEITALQSQVNPHFIINALESVYWSLIQKNDMDNAGILMAMAKLFQYILKGSDRITIDQELTFVEQYLQVEKFRFGDRLRIPGGAGGALHTDSQAAYSPVSRKFHEIRGRNHLFTGSHRHSHCGKWQWLCHICHRQRPRHRSGDHGADPGIL